MMFIASCKFFDRFFDMKNFISLLISLSLIADIFWFRPIGLWPIFIMIGSLSMALKYSLGEEIVASKIDLAIKNLIKQGYRTKDISNDENYLKTSEVAQKIIENIENE